jgi:hypothetical protein
MPVPFFPLLGLPNALTLLDPTTAFTPLACGLGLLSSLWGLGLGVLIARADVARTRRCATPPSTPPALPKVA